MKTQFVFIVCVAEIVVVIIRMGIIAYKIHMDTKEVKCTFNVHAELLISRYIECKNCLSQVRGKMYKTESRIAPQSFVDRFEYNKSHNIEEEHDTKIRKIIKDENGVDRLYVCKRCKDEAILSNEFPKQERLVKLYMVNKKGNIFDLEAIGKMTIGKFYHSQKDKYYREIVTMFENYKYFLESQGRTSKKSDFGIGKTRIGWFESFEITESQLIEDMKERESKVALNKMIK